MFFADEFFTVQLKNNLPVDLNIKILVLVVILTSEISETGLFTISVSENLVSKLCVTSKLENVLLNV